MSKPRYECEVCKKVFVNADEKNNCLKSHKMPRLSTYQWAKGNPYPSTIVASFVVGEKIMDVRYRVESITENICGCGDHIVHYPGEPDIQCKCGAWICHTCAVLGRKCECGEYIEIEPAGSHTWRMRRREDIEQD